jgi:hypothetical protein
MQHNNGSNKPQNEVTSHSVFDLKCENDGICLISPTRYTKGDKVTTGLFEFFKRLNKKIGNFIDDDFDWSNIIIAGGLISGLMESHPNMSEYQQSDVDIFVYGDKNTVVNKIQEIYQYFVKKLDKKFYAFVYTPNTPIICIVIPGKCAIQVIGTNFNNWLEVLNSFDLTHCQVGFNGTHVLHTDEYVEAVRTRITKITKRSIHAYRLVKTYHRGYSIKKPSYCYIKNIFHEYTALPGRSFANTDKDYDINNLQYIIEELENNQIVINNLTKNYIPSIDSINTTTEEMVKIGTLYAGENKYKFINGHGNDIFVEDIRHLLIFTRMPFLC